MTWTCSRWWSGCCSSVAALIWGLAETRRRGGRLAAAGAAHRGRLGRPGHQPRRVAPPAGRTAGAGRSTDALARLSRGLAGRPRPAQADVRAGRDQRRAVRRAPPARAVGPRCRTWSRAAPAPAPPWAEPAPAAGAGAAGLVDVGVPAVSRPAGPPARDEGPSTQAWAPARPVRPAPAQPLTAASAQAPPLRRGGQVRVPGGRAGGPRRGRPRRRAPAASCASARPWSWPLALVAAGVWWFAFREPGSPHRRTRGPSAPASVTGRDRRRPQHARWCGRSGSRTTGSRSGRR